MSAELNPCWNKPPSPGWYDTRNTRGTEIRMWWDGDHWKASPHSPKPCGWSAVDQDRAWRAPSQPAEPVKLEALRQEQVAMVMPLIGPLLDAWDGISRDARSDLQSDAPSLASNLQKIAAAMENESQPAEPVAQAETVTVPLRLAADVLGALFNPTFNPPAVERVKQEFAALMRGEPVAQAEQPIKAIRALVEGIKGIASDLADCEEKQRLREHLRLIDKQFLAIATLPYSPFAVKYEYRDWQPSHPAAEQAVASEREAFTAWYITEEAQKAAHLRGWMGIAEAAWMERARRPVRELTDAEIDAVLHAEVAELDRMRVGWFIFHKFARALLARATGEDGQ